MAATGSGRIGKCKFEVRIRWTFREGSHVMCKCESISRMRPNSHSVSLMHNARTIAVSLMHNAV